MSTRTRPEQAAHVIETAGESIAVATRRYHPPLGVDELVLPTEGWVSHTTDKEPPPRFILRICVEGVTELVMHNARTIRMMDEWNRKNRSKMQPPPEVYCEWASYRDQPNQPHCFITEPFILMLREINTIQIKIPTQSRRVSLARALRGALTPITDKAILTSDREGQKPIYQHEIYEDPVVVNNSRVMRYRPRIHPPWYLTIYLVYQHTQLYGSEMWRTLHEAWLQAGGSVGIGDGRPQKGRHFGKFNTLSVDVNQIL